MYLFLRQRGLSRLPALVGTAPFTFSGFFFIFSNSHFFRSYEYLPILLFLAERTIRSRRPLPLVALGFAVAGNLLLGMPEASVFVLGTLALYCLFLIASPPEPVRRGPAILRFGGAAALGLALAAPLLLPAREYLSLSFSIHEPGSKLGIVADPPGFLLNWITPYVFGDVTANFQGGRFSGTRDWVGAASAMAVLGAMASPRAMRRHGGWFFLGLGGLVLAKGYGLPVLRWVGELPVLEQTIMPVFALPVVGFCVAVLVGIGMQGAMDAGVRRRWLLVLTALSLAGVLVLVRVNRPLLAAAPPGHLVRQFGLAALCACFGALGFVLRSKAGSMLVALAVLGELLLLTPRGFQAERADPFVRPAWLNYVIEHTATSKERVFATDAKLFPNTAGVYGLQDIRSLDAVYPDRYVTFIKSFIQPEFYDRFVGGPFGTAGEQRWPAEVDNNPMFDLTGVRYVITAGPEPGSTTLKAFFAANPATHVVRPSIMDVGGDRRTVLSILSGAKATLAVPQGARTLSFAFALDPQAFANPQAEGVDAFVASGGAPRARLWATSVVPREAAVRPEWHEATVEIPSGASSVDLVVNPRSVPGAHWAGFADLRFGGDTPAPDPQYRPVASSDGTEVFENLRRFPRALVVHEVASVRNGAEALRYFESVSRPLPSGALAVDQFDPSKEAVLEGLARSARSRLRGCDSPGRAAIRSYDDDDIVLDVETSCPGVVLLTDTYYPGWKAKVNGRSTPIHPADLAFRGVFVEAGRSRVEFHYRPQSFRAGLVASLLGALAALVALTVPPLRRRVRSAGLRRAGASQHPGQVLEERGPGHLGVEVL
jgi:hypothetical protein